jgi:16S rRNA (uracil1498-N3)-methyltransferase
MTDPLFLANLEGVKPGDLVTLDGSEGRHAAMVRRIRAGEMVLLSDGAGLAVRGQVVVAAKDSVDVRVSEPLSRRPPALRTVAVQALAKGERSDIAVEAMTEQGVDEIIAWQASRSIVRWQNKAEKGLTKWRSAAIAATKQSRRFRIPQVAYATTDEIVARVRDADLALVLHEDAEQPLSALSLPAQGECLFIIGPEGGISPDETEAFRAAGAKLVSVADAVLRASTAGVVALAQVQALSAVSGSAASGLHAAPGN